MADELKYDNIKDLNAAFKANKLNSDEYERQRDLLREINEISKDWAKTLSSKIVKSIGDFGDKTEEVEESLQRTLQSSDDIHKSAGNLYTAMTGILNPATSFFTLLELAANRFVELDNAALSFRTTTGFLASQTAQVESNIRKTSLDLAKFGVDAAAAAQAASSIANAFNDTAMASEKNVKFVAEMQANIGVSADDSAALMKNFMATGGASSETARNTTASAISLAKMAGVPVAKVMQDVAKAAGTTLALVRGNSMALVKAAIEARRLGLELKDVGGAAESLLDFNSSIANEMEASVLMGKNLNLQKARELAYAGDLKGLAKEQSRLVSSMGDISKKDIFQQKAIAAAMGLSLENLQSMSAKQQEMNELRKVNPDLAKQYEAELDTLDNQKESVEEKYKRELETRQLQSQQQKIANDLKAVFVQISEALLPLIKILIFVGSIVIRLGAFVMKFLFIPFNLINNIVDYLQEKTTAWGESSTWKTISGWMDKISGAFDYLTGKTESWGQGVIQAIAGIGIAILLLKSQLSPLKLLGKSSIFSVETFKAAKAGILDFGKSLLGIKKLGGITGGATGAVGGAAGIAGSAGKMAPIDDKSIATTKKADTVFKSFGKTMKDIGGGIRSFLSSVGKGIGAFLQGIAVGMRAFANPMVILGTAIVVGALIGIAVAARIAAPAIIAIGTAVKLLFEGIGAIIVSAGTALSKVIVSLGESFKLVAEGIKTLASVGFTGLVGVAAGIYALSGALVAFGAAMTVGGIGSFLGGGVVNQLMGLTSIGSQLSTTADSISSIGTSLSLFKDESIVNGIDAVTRSILELNDAIEKTNMLKVMALTAMNASAAGVAQAKGQGGNDVVAGKLDELIGLMKSGAIGVNIDGNRASYLLAKNTRERGSLGAIA